MQRISLIMVGGFLGAGKTTLLAETASTDDPSVQKVLYFGEVVGTFVKQGVLDRGLVSDMWWMEGLWSRVAPAARRWREHVGEPRFAENFEKLAGG